MEFRFMAPGPDGGSPPAPARLPAIQILRALAALAIALLHALNDAGSLSARIGGAFAARDFLPLAAGVDLFFVISGFVMVYASRDDFGKGSAVLPFLRRRAARIIPIYWAATVIYLAISLGGLGPVNRPLPDGWEIAASFLFIPWLAGPGPLVQPVYGLGWTLNYEMFFYLLFALVLPLRRDVAVPLLVGVLMALVLAGQFVPFEQVQLHFWTRSIILEFGFGLIIGRMALSGVRPTRGLAALLAAAALALLWLAAARPALFPDRALMYGLPAALLVIAALAFDELRLDNPLVRLGLRLGDASYAIYLLHPFVIRGLAVAGGAALVSVSPWLFIGLALVLICIVSVAAWRWFERPVTRALQGSRRKWSGEG
jgi:peptidoglycan/LPS O-acetylase OafA/YrhL